MANFTVPAAPAPAGSAAGAAGRRGELPAGLVVRRAQDLQARPAVREGDGHEVHADPGGEGSRLHHEAERGDRRQGLPHEERHRPGEVRAGGAQDLREGRGDHHGARRAREAHQEAGGGGRLDRGQGAVAGHQPPRARDDLLADPRQPRADQAQRRRLPQRRPGRDLEAHDGVRAGGRRRRARRHFDSRSDAASTRWGRRKTITSAAGCSGTSRRPAQNPPAAAQGRAAARQRRRPRSRTARRSTRPRAATTAASSSTRTTTRSSTAATRTPPCRSDSGRIFAPTGWDGNGKTHVDHRSVWVDPLNSKHILSANDGGTSETWDGGAHWSQKSTINAQQFYDVSVDNEHAVQHHGRHAGQRRVDRAVAEPQQLRHVRQRLALPADGRRRSTSSATGGTRSTSTTRASSARRAGRTSTPARRRSSRRG